MNKFESELLLTLRALTAAMGELTDAIRNWAPPPSKPPSSRKGKAS